MRVVFNASEILEIACQIERNGAQFYRRAAELVEQEDLKKLLHELAEMEDGHEALFDSMRDDEELLFQPRDDRDDLVAKYPRALAGSHIFTYEKPPSILLEEGASAEKILEKAVQLELESIAYYHGIRAGMSKEHGKRKVSDIIHEEMGHAAVLTDKISELRFYPNP